MRPLIRFAIPLLLGAAPVLAVEPPAWGQFTREELFSTHFPEAPGADAVILYDHCEVKVDPKFQLRVSRHRRTKIFTPAGVSRREIRIPYGAEDKILDLVGHTVIPPERFVKLEKKHTREEVAPDGSRVLVVSFPDVAPGAILECSYTHWAKQLQRIEPWAFQNDDYTRVSSLDLQIPPGMKYDSEFGWLPTPVPAPVRQTVIDADRPDRQLEQSTWTFANLAPYRPEPLLSNPVDFRTTLHLQLLAHEWDGRRTEIAPTWAALSAAVQAGWAASLADDRGVKEWAASVTGETPEQHAAALYRKVQGEIADAVAASPLALPPLRDILESRSASPAAKNVLLVQLLRAAGIAADPVLVRPRSRGGLREKWQVLDQFEHVIARVNLPGRTLWADARGGPCPFGVLPPDLRVHSGLLVAPTAGSLVELSLGEVPSSIEAKTVARLDPAGDLAGTIEWTFTGYEALRARSEILRDGAPEYARRILQANFGPAEVDSVQVDALDDCASPLVVRTGFRRPAWAAVTGDRMECRVPLVLAPATPLISAGSRTFPIELPFASTHDETVRLDLPETFRVARSPAGGRTGSEDLTYSLSVESTEASVSARRRFVIREPQIQPARAAGVQQLYDKVLATDGEKLVVSRSAFGSASR